MLSDFFLKQARMEETGLDVDFGSSPEFGTVSYQRFASSKVFGVWGSKRLGLVEQGVGRAQCGWKVSGRLLAAEVVEIESGMDDFHVLDLPQKVAVFHLIFKRKGSMLAICIPPKIDFKAYESKDLDGHGSTDSPGGGS